MLFVYSNVSSANRLGGGFSALFFKGTENKMLAIHGELVVKFEKKIDKIYKNIFPICCHVFAETKQLQLQSHTLQS